MGSTNEGWVGYEVQGSGRTSVKRKFKFSDYFEPIKLSELRTKPITKKELRKMRKTLPLGASLGLMQNNPPILHINFGVLVTDAFGKKVKPKMMCKVCRHEAHPWGRCFGQKIDGSQCRHERKENSHVNI